MSHTITQEEYNEHDKLLQKQCKLITSDKFNSKVYEREWEWCRNAAKANRSLAPEFHDFILEVENDETRNG